MYLAVVHTKGVTIIFNTEMKVSKGTFSCALEIFENHSFGHGGIETRFYGIKRKE